MVIDNEWSKRISINPKIHQGDPCIAGTRFSISEIVGGVANGDIYEQILDSYAQLTREDI